MLQSHKPIPTLFLVILFVAALLPRVWLAIEFPSSIGDGETYNLVADNIRLNGCVSLSPIEEAKCVPHAGGNQPPGYPILVAAIHKTFGRSDKSVAITQATVSALAIVIATQRLSGLFPPPAALFAGIALALSFVSIAWSRLVFTESMSIALSSVMLIEALRVRAGSGPLSVYLLGGLMGAAIFFRYDGLLLAIPVGALLLWGRPIRNGLRNITIVGIIAILPLAVWGVRNAIRDLPPISVEYIPKNGWPPPTGYIAWVNTWLISQFDYPNVMFPIASGAYRTVRIPETAYTGYDDRTTVEQLLVELQRHNGQPFPAHLDQAFATLAANRRDETSLTMRGNLYLRRAIHLWGTPFFSSAWPVQVDAQTRNAALDRGGMFSLALANPLATLIKGLGAVYRISLLFCAFAVTLFAIRARHSLLTPLLLAALSFAVVRTGAFSVLGLTETRYLSPNLAWLEVGVAIGVATLLADRRTKHPHST